MIMAIDYTDPDWELPEFMLTGSSWLTEQDQRLQDYRTAMYEREVTLAAILIERVKSGQITVMEYSYRMGQLTYHNVKGLARLDAEINACRIHEGCWGKGEGHE
jgi:hypothetical protein